MLTFSTFNLIMAMAIAVTIVVISLVRSPILKAVIYGLPIPITLALIASQKGVDTSHIVGLFLLTSFLWLVNWLKGKGVNIFVADMFSAVVYVVVGYVLTRLDLEKDWLFWSFSAAYFFLWLAFMFLFPRGIVLEAGRKEKVDVVIKGAVVFSVATLLLTLKDLLRGIVVTFPFSGVFTVLEMRNQLHVLSREFTRNSIAILAFFIAIYLTTTSFGPYLAIVVGWVVYLIALRTVLLIGKR